MKCQTLFSGKNEKTVRKFYLACLAFKRLCQEKMALIAYEGNEHPD